MSHRFGPRTRLSGSGFEKRVAQWTQRSLVKFVQTGTIVISAGSNTASLSPGVVTANTILLFGGCTPSGNDVPISSYGRVELTNSTTVTATVNTSSGNTLSVVYTVMEFWPGVIRSVQRGTIVVTTTAAISAVNVNKSFVTYLGFTTAKALSDDAANFRLPRLELTNSTTVTGTAGAADATIGYQVVEFF